MLAFICGAIIGILLVFSVHVEKKRMKIMFDGLFAIIGGAISGFFGLLGGLFNPAPAPQDFVKFDDPVVMIEEKKKWRKRKK